ncbi:MAG: hypothetical protein NXI15_04215 [Gammaproteobacteria bacterium]|nr:hypothetical protein [Gammaproteobacteria bacterium]
MDTIEERAKTANELWTSALKAEAEGNYIEAYKLHTEAHDLIMDCARLHQAAHVHLRRVNYQIGNYGELVTDWLLHLFAPLGVFELVSYFSRTGVFGAAFCKRSA